MKLKILATLFAVMPLTMDAATYKKVTGSRTLAGANGTLDIDLKLIVQVTDYIDKNLRPEYKAGIKASSGSTWVKTGSSTMTADHQYSIDLTYSTGGDRYTAWTNFEATAHSNNIFLKCKYYEYRVKLSMSAYESTPGDLQMSFEATPQYRSIKENPTSINPCDHSPPMGFPPNPTITSGYALTGLGENIESRYFEEIDDDFYGDESLEHYHGFGTTAYPSEW